MHARTFILWMSLIVPLFAAPLPVLGAIQRSKFVVDHVNIPAVAAALNMFKREPIIKDALVEARSDTLEDNVENDSEDVAEEEIIETHEEAESDAFDKRGRTQGGGHSNGKRGRTQGGGHSNGKRGRTQGGGHSNGKRDDSE